MRIKIVITDTAPLYPPLWGGPKRIWGLFSNLAQDLFDITYVGIDCTLTNGKKYNFNKPRDNFKQILCSLPTHYYPWHAVEKSIIRNSSLDLFPYLCMHTDWHFKHILNSQKTDILVCSHPWSNRAISKGNSNFFIYDAHNCEYLLMGQILRKRILKDFILKQIKKTEGDLCRRSDLILACSEKEKEDFINLYHIPPDKIIIVPNGTNVKEWDATNKPTYRKRLSISSEDKVIIFIGEHYKPNIEAVKFIIRRISVELQEFKFLVVGGVSAAFNTERLPSNIKLLGRVSDGELDVALKASDIAINPMFAGSGVNIKMLDYMSYGLPIVTTKCGARGIETFARQPMIVSTIDKFTENIKLLAANNVLYKLMSKDCESLVAEYYDWRKISSKLQQLIIGKFKH